MSTLTQKCNKNTFLLVQRASRKLSWKQTFIKLPPTISCNSEFSHNFIFTVKPLTVEILNKKLPLVADRRYEVQCESSGSKPNAIITWYKGKRQLKRAKVSDVHWVVIFCWKWKQTLVRWCWKFNTRRLLMQSLPLS